MRILISGATKTLRKFAVTHPDLLGILAIPNGRHAPAALASYGLPISADNGCFGGLDSQKFVVMLNSFMDKGVALEWVTVPDVVGNARETFSLWSKWAPIVMAFGFPPALVIQDGATLENVSPLDPPVVFIGGSTEYKTGHEARRIVEHYRARGRPVHMGRVNTYQRVKYAIRIGCTSCDGSGFSKWPEQKIPLGIKWIEKTIRRDKNQPSLF